MVNCLECFRKIADSDLSGDLPQDSFADAKLDTDVIIGWCVPAAEAVGSMFLYKLSLQVLEVKVDLVACPFRIKRDKVNAAERNTAPCQVISLDNIC